MFGLRMRETIGLVVNNASVRRYEIFKVFLLTDTIFKWGQFYNNFNSP